MANTHLHFKSRFSTVADMEKSIRQSHRTYNTYLNLNQLWKKHFQDFMLGKRTLPLTYDPFFKRIFNPDIHPDRLSRLISSVIGQKVSVLQVLNSEDVALKGASLIIMDIVVRLADGCLTTVEIQKVASLFPGERIACYTADLILREYERLRAARNNEFTYGDMKKVYTIVIYEDSDDWDKSPVFEAFHREDMKHTYVHHGKTVFDSGLPLELLHECYLIPLDVFKENGYAKDDNELTMWLSLLATDSIAEAEALIARYPYLDEIYIEMSEYMQNPEEAVSMYSEALRVLDENTAKYMVDRLKMRNEEQVVEINGLKNEVGGLKNEVGGLKNENSGLKNENSGLKNENSGLKNENSELKDENLATIKALIQSIQQFKGTKEFAIEKLLSDCGKSQEEAKALVDTYWFDVVK